MEAGSKLAGGICDAIGAASGETTAIAEGNTLQSLALAKQNKCPVFISQQLAETTGTDHTLQHCSCCGMLVVIMTNSLL